MVYENLIPATPFAQSSDPPVEKECLFYISTALRTFTLLYMRLPAVFVTKRGCIFTFLQIVCHSPHH